MSKETPSAAVEEIIRLYWEKKPGRFNPFTHESAVKQGWIIREINKEKHTVRYSLSDKAIAYMQGKGE